MHCSGLVHLRQQSEGVGGAKSNLSTAEEPVVFNHVETYKFCQVCGDSNVAVFFLKGKKTFSSLSIPRCAQGSIIQLACLSVLCMCNIQFVVFTDYESCTRPISTSPGCMEAGEYG